MPNGLLEGTSAGTSRNFVQEGKCIGFSLDNIAADVAAYMSWYKLLPQFKFIASHDAGGKIYDKLGSHLRFHSASAAQKALEMLSETPPKK